MASDLARDGMWLELYDSRLSRELVMTAFYSDADGSFVFERLRDDVAEDVESWFHQEARRRLPPMP